MKLKRGNNTRNKRVVSKKGKTCKKKNNTIKGSIIIKGGVNNNLSIQNSEQYKNTALCLLWVNRNLNADAPTIFANKDTDTVTKEIYTKVAAWKQNHPYLTVYIGYDSRFVTDDQLQKTKDIFPETNFIDLVTLIDDEFISKLNDFTKEHMNTDAMFTITNTNTKLNPGARMKPASSFHSLPKEFVLDYVLGIKEVYMPKEDYMPYYNTYDNPYTKNEHSPLYFRVDMWRLILTLYLEKTFHYNYVIYTDIDIDPTQDALSTSNLFDEKTKQILNTIGFVVNSKQLKSTNYENSFHIMNNNEKTTDAILIVCIYMNIIRFKYYTLRMFMPDKNLCLASAFTEIVYIVYAQLFPYLLYLYGYINYFLPAGDNKKTEISLKDKKIIISYLGFNCRNNGISACKHILNFKFNEDKRKQIPFLSQNGKQGVIMTDSKYYDNMPFGNFPIKAIETVPSTQAMHEC